MGDLIIWRFGLFLPVRQAGDYLGVSGGLPPDEGRASSAATGF